MDGPECFGCGGATPGGLSICGRYLCPTCEDRIMKSKAEKNDYDYWVGRFREFWERLSADLSKEPE